MWHHGLLNLRAIVFPLTDTDSYRLIIKSFLPPCRRSVCSQLMENISCTKGDFAIRESQEVYNKFLLTVKMKNDYKNYEIHHQPPDEYYIEEGQTFKKLEDLVNHYQHNEVCRLTNYDAFFLLRLISLVSCL